MRPSTAVSVVVLVLGGAGIGACGGDDGDPPAPAHCGSVQDLDDSVGDISDIDYTSSTGLDELKEGMAAVREDLADVRADAQEEFSAQLTRTQDSYAALAASVDAAQSGPGDDVTAVKDALAEFNAEAQTLVSDLQITC